MPNDNTNSENNSIRSTLPGTELPQMSGEVFNYNENDVVPFTPPLSTLTNQSILPTVFKSGIPDNGHAIVSSLANHKRNKNKGENLTPLQKAYINARGIREGGMPELIGTLQQDVKLGSIAQIQSDGEAVMLYDKYTGIDDAQRAYENQSNWEAIRNGIGRFGGMVVKDVAGGLVGLVVGAGYAIANGDMHSWIDNDYFDMLHDADIRLHSVMPTYTSNEMAAEGFFGKLGHISYWAGDFADNLAFMASAVIETAAVTALTGGVGTSADLAAIFARKGAMKALRRGGIELAEEGLEGVTRSAFKKGIKEGVESSLEGIGRGALKGAGEDVLSGTAKKVAQNNLDNYLFDVTKGTLKPLERTVSSLNKEGMDILRNGMMRGAKKGAKLGKVLNVAKYVGTGGQFEAGMEARDMMRQSTSQYIQSYKMSHNGELPSATEMSSYITSVQNAADGTFWANLGLLTVTEGMVFGDLLGFPKIGSKFGNRLLGLGVKKAEDGTLKMAKANAFQKVLGNVVKVGKPMFGEGLQEGGQGVISNAAQLYTNAKYDGDASQTLSLSEAIGKATNHMITTKEGRSQIFSGFLLGMLGGSIINGVGGSVKNARLKAKAIRKGGTAEGISWEGIVPEGFGKKSYKAQRAKIKAAVDVVNTQTKAFRNTVTADAALNFHDTNLGTASETANNYSLMKAYDDLHTYADVEKMVHYGIDNIELTKEDMKRMGVNSEEKLADYKEHLKDQFTKDYKVYKKSQEFSDNLGLQQLNTMTSKGNIKEIQDAITFQAMLAGTNGNRADAAAKQIEDFMGENGLADVLRYESNLSDKVKNQINEIRKHKKKIAKVRGQLIKMTAEQENNIDDKNTKKIARKRTLMANSLAEMEARQQEMESKLNDKIRPMKDLFGDDIGSGSVSVDDIIDKKDKLEDYINTLREDGRHREADKLEQLVKDYNTFAIANKALTSSTARLADDRFFEKKDGKSFMHKILGDKYEASDGFKKALKDNDFEVLGLLAKHFGVNLGDVTAIAQHLEQNEDLSDREKKRVDFLTTSYLSSNALYGSNIVETENEGDSENGDDNNVSPNSNEGGNPLGVIKSRTPKGKELNRDTIDNFDNPITEEKLAKTPLDVLQEFVDQVSVQMNKLRLNDKKTSKEIADIEERLAKLKRVQERLKDGIVDTEALKDAGIVLGKKDTEKTTETEKELKKTKEELDGVRKDIESAQRQLKVLNNSGQESKETSGARQETDQENVALAKKKAQERLTELNNKRNNLNDKIERLNKEVKNSRVNVETNESEKDAISSIIKQAENDIKSIEKDNDIVDKEKKRRIEEIKRNKDRQIGLTKLWYAKTKVPESESVFKAKQEIADINEQIDVELKKEEINPTEIKRLEKRKEVLEKVISGQKTIDDIVAEELVNAQKDKLGGLGYELQSDGTVKSPDGKISHTKQEVLDDLDRKEKRDISDIKEGNVNIQQEIKNVREQYSNSREIVEDVYGENDKLTPVKERNENEPPLTNQEVKNYIFNSILNGYSNDVQAVLTSGGLLFKYKEGKKEYTLGDLIAKIKEDGQTDIENVRQISNMETNNGNQESTATSARDYFKQAEDKTRKIRQRKEADTKTREAIEEVERKLKELKEPVDFGQHKIYKRYQSLWHKQRAGETLTKKEEKEYEELGDLIDNYFGILGVRAGGVDLSDVLKQIEVLLKTQVRKSNTQEVTDEQIQEDATVVDRTSRNNHNIGLNFKGVYSKRKGKGEAVVYELSGLTFKGMKDMLDKYNRENPNNPIEYGGRLAETSEKSTITLTNDLVEKINKSGIMRIGMPFKGSGTYYGMVLRRVEVDGKTTFEPLKSDYEDPINTVALRNVKTDNNSDEGEEVGFRINLKSQRNKEVLGELRDKYAIEELIEEEIQERIDKEYNKKYNKSKKKDKSEEWAKKLKEKVEKEVRERAQEETGFEDISEQDKNDIIDNIQIEIVDKDGNATNVLKATRPNSSNIQKDSEYEKHIALRQQIVGEVSEILADFAANQRERTSDVKVKAKSFLPGLPNMHLTEENGKMSMQYAPITEQQLDKIEDVGVVKNGKVITKKETKNINTTFVRSAIEQTKGDNVVQVPFIVVKAGENKIAFPVKIAKEEAPYTAEDFKGVYENKQLDMVTKINMLNEMLAESSIDITQPKKCFVAIGDVTNLNDVTFNSLMNLLESKVYIGSVGEWTDKNTSIKDNLIGRATTTLKLNEDSFVGGKLVLDYSNIKVDKKSTKKASEKVTTKAYDSKINSIFAEVENEKC